MVAATKKKPKPQHRSPAYTVFARIPPGLGEAFEAYLDSLKPRPSTTGAVALAIEEFLTSRGFWLAPKKEAE